MNLARRRPAPDETDTALFGYELLNDPLLNKGTAFSEEERDLFELHGLLPPNVATLDEQVGRRLQAFRQLPNDLARYQRIAVVGGGSAGCGISGLLLDAMIAGGLPEKEARSRFFLVDRDGLLVEGMPEMLPFQKRFVQPRSAVAGWQLDLPDRVSLLDVVRNAHPTILIGVSGQAGAFPANVVRLMAQFVQRPIIFPLSNPTSQSEAAPADLLEWTKGQAIIGTGSPFPSVLKNGRHQPVDQTNNAYVFPGLGLGTIAARAHRISDGILMAAARTLADLSPARRDPSANLLPPVNDLRQVCFRVAAAVAMQAQKEGLAEATSPAELEARIQSKIWAPDYRPYSRQR